MSGSKTITVTPASILTALTFLVVSITSFQSRADEDQEVFWSDWQVNGFGTIGYINSERYDNRVPRRGVYQNGQRIHNNGLLMDSRFGMQVKGDLNDHWSVVGQMVLREQFDDELDSYVDIAFLKYQATNGWQVGIGRQAFDLFFLSDHRNTGYSYEWVRPPTQFYGFMPYESFDGIKVSKDWGDFDNDWHWSFSYGSVSSKFQSEIYVEDDEIESIGAKPAISTELTWQTGQWRLRASYAHFKVEQDVGIEEDFGQFVEYVEPYWADFGRIVRDFSKSNSFSYGSLGAAWAHDDWKVQAEWNRVKTDYIGFSGDRAYLSVSKRFGKFQPFVYSSYASDSQQVRYRRPAKWLGPEFAEFYHDVESFVQGMRHNERGIGVGVRWDFAPQQSLKIQLDRYFFDAGSGSVYGRVDEDYRRAEDNSWLSVAYDWVF